MKKYTQGGGTFYDDVEQSLKKSLVNDYVEMERACLKEDFPMACFHYIKQLETIVGFGLSVLIKKINLDIKQGIDESLELSSLGKKIFVHAATNPKTTEKILKNINITLTDIQWTEKLNLFTHYYDITFNWDINSLAYYKRNLHAHSTNSNTEKEQKFQELFPSSFDFMTKTRTQLTKYIKALKIPKNR